MRKILLINIHIMQLKHEPHYSIVKTRLQSIPDSFIILYRESFGIQRTLTTKFRSYIIEMVIFLTHKKGGMRLSSFALRIIALVCMIIDHTGLALFPDLLLLRCIGRLSFPLYCFLLVQGYMHTRDVAAYGRRLALLAILSEIPYDLLIFGRTFSPADQNVLFSLLLGLMALYSADLLREKPLHAGLTVCSLCLCAMAANVSYGWLGIALCLSMRYSLENRRRLVIGAGGFLLVYSLTLMLSGVASYWALTSLCALFSLVPMLIYNGKKGFRHPTITFLFYAAYPVHIAALVTLRMMHVVPPGFF